MSPNTSAKVFGGLGRLEASRWQYLKCETIVGPSIMKAIGSSVLLSWVAVNNDPYERDRDRGYRLVDGQPIPGPTLTLLFDDASSLAGKIREVVLFHRKTEPSENDREQRAVEETVQAIKERNSDIQVHLEVWQGTDPTDHRSIFEFLREKTPAIRRRFPGSELIIHVSPGTGAMHTVWVLMAETGFFERPFRVVQSLRRDDRRGRPAIIPLELGIETFYKVYKASRPAQMASDEQGVTWDPARFQSVRMKTLFTEARRFAHLNVPILLLGERGTGKTTLASWIRLHSPFRREGQDAHWPAVACGQYTQETMRAELFGFRKGSFTGATSDKEGLLAAADGDTLFLDEVGDVSRDLQRLLIKALEEKRYFPLGDDRPRKSNFRLLAATNLELHDLRSRLDPDFLDRIGLLTLQLPSLREIRDEIDWLWEVTYEQAAQRAGVSKRTAQMGGLHHRRVVAHLRNHPLPGNLRDLFGVAYRILAALSDPHEPLAPEEALEYGMRALAGPQSATSEDWVSRAIARAFADSRPLDGVLDSVTQIPTKVVERDLKAFMAAELRRLSKERSLPVEQLCDVTDRALRSWAGRSVTGESSEGRKKSSESGER